MISSDQVDSLASILFSLTIIWFGCWCLFHFADKTITYRNTHLKETLVTFPCRVSRLSWNLFHKNNTIWKSGPLFCILKVVKIKKWNFNITLHSLFFPYAGTKLCCVQQKGLVPATILLFALTEQMGQAYQQIPAALKAAKCFKWKNGKNGEKHTKEHRLVHSWLENHNFQNLQWWLMVRLVKFESK